MGAANSLSVWVLAKSIGGVGKVGGGGVGVDGGVKEELEWEGRWEMGKWSNFLS